jgi:mRNA interferase MazF
MKRGDLYLVRKLPADAPKKQRVFVVVSRQTLVDARYSTVICAPVYTHGHGLHTEVSVGTDEGLKHPSWIACDNLASLPKSRLTNYLGSLPASKLPLLASALKMALDLR